MDRALLLKMFANMVRNRERPKPKKEKIPGLYDAVNDEKLFERFDELRRNGDGVVPVVKVSRDIFRPPNIKGSGEIKRGARQGKRAKPRKTMKGHRARMKRAKSQLMRQVKKKGEKKRKRK